VSTPDRGTASAGPWLLLIHQIPPKPDYFRVKVRRRLRRLGAVPIKSSVYALPATAEAREDFEWLAREIEQDGGEAAICEASFVAGLADDQVRDLFRSARDEDYREIASAAREQIAGSDPSRRQAEVARLRQRLAELARIDFFAAPARREAEEAVAESERLHRAERAAGTDADEASYHGRTWVTRRDVRVDRIASAWLVRRFIDPAARFAFVSARGHVPAPGEVRFDMYDAEFTHEGDRCTFETLVARFGLKDRGLRAIGEIVHDVDCKDDRFGREEAAGVATLIAGIARATDDDAERLARGAAIFDELYAALGPRP
jgi:hypothetical protein